MKTNKFKNAVIISIIVIFCLSIILSLKTFENYRVFADEGYILGLAEDLIK